MFTPDMLNNINQYNNSNNTNLNNTNNMNLNHSINNNNSLDMIQENEEQKLNVPKEQLQLYVKQWITYDDEIKALQQAIKERKKLKNEISDVIMNFMAQNEIPHFNLSDGKLIYSKSQQTQPVNLNYLKEALPKSNLLSQQQYQELFDYIQNNRAKKITTKLKRTHKHDKNKSNT